MNVRLVMPTANCHGNILWPQMSSGACRARNGYFPKTHPAAHGSAVFGATDPFQGGNSDSMTKFRSRGYWASCFPEGDGIVFKCDGKSAAEVATDVVECFGFTVTEIR